MSVTINARFWRRKPGTGRKRHHEHKSVHGLQFDTTFVLLTVYTITAHPKAPPVAEGWTLQGYAYVEGDKE